MGTPDFAIPSLKRLIEDGHEVLLCVTQPDKPKGRGKKIQMPVVKEFAIKNNIEVFQPKTLKTDEAYEKISSFDIDVFVTAAFGQILTKKILGIPKFGCVNVHASLLPAYRGAAPIQWAIVNGEQITGITTMLTDVGLDTGDILLKREVEIEPDMTAGSLHDILSFVGADVLSETLKKIEDKAIERIPQDDENASYAPMLKKEDGFIDWSRSSREIHDQIRGLNPFPGAYTYYEECKMRIWKSSIIHNVCVVDSPGKVLDVSKDGLIVATGDCAIKIEEVQFDSCRRMCVCEYLCGHEIKEGACF